jgi:hypothetical protein
MPDSLRCATQGVLFWSARLSGGTPARRKFGAMHEEYQPGYNWEDLIEKKFKATIPWQDFEDDDTRTELSGDEPDTDR